MSINDSLQQLKELKGEIKSLQSEFVKNIVTISAGLLALLISLTPSLQYSRLLFLSTLLLLLSSIFFGVAMLYFQLFQFRRMDKDLVEAIKMQLKNRSETFEPVFSKNNTLLKVVESICLLSFVSACILLVAFAFYKYY